MSILKKAYTISVWDDIWDEKTSKFVEKRLGIIGSDKMESHCRAMSPNFTRNVNGTKKLTFKMYYRYKDNITGEFVKNPFVDWLISERKVKLYYEDKWYDFIVKNIVENSKDYVYTYQLEDALVQELSKNGFNVTLDSKLMNNLGTANELAAEVLKETDWEVSPESEVFVQTIEEALIYGRLPNDWPRGLDIYRIFDQDKDNRQVGVDPKLVGTDGVVGPKAGDEILMFYSSAEGKPYRFQFIWVDSSTPIKKDKENRVIVNENCQFYFDVPKESDYLLTDGYYLPYGIKSTSHDEDGVNVTLSSLYRGKRYGFTQRTKFIPILDKYVNIYQKDGKEYYGYLHSEYNSPALIQNVISNTQFESTSGWTGARQEGGKKAKVENVYGRFDGGKFVSALSDLQEGTFKATKGSYTAYLKITFDGSKSIVVNSGPYDNRISIGEMNVGDEWALWYKVLNSSGNQITNLSQGPQFKLSEEKYDSSVDAYKPISSSLTFTPFANNNVAVQITKDGKTTNKTYQLSTVGGTAKSKEEFKKKSQVRLIISPPSGATDNNVYYIELIELFKATYNNGKLITLEEQGETVEDRVIDKSYYYFPSSAITTLEDKEQLIPETVSKTLLNDTYVPCFNVGAEKIRSINQKESNYFNILQTIAETFEAWLLLEVERAKANDSDGYSEGSIKKKWIKFKNYIGKDNYAGFKYGVNLDSIQRTNESKSIVTKLMVKPNNNQYAKNGFCTIARANANPTGETFIYDFQYFINRGLLNARQYLDNVYVPQANDSLGADMAVYLGKEIRYSKDGTSWASIADEETKYYQIKNNGSWGATYDYGIVKIPGYFGRLKALNRKITDQNELLINTAKDLTQYKAKYEIAKSGLEAAESGIEKVYADYEFLTNKKMVDSSGKPIAIEEAEAARSDVKKLLEEYLVYSENKTKYALDEEKIGEDLATAQSKYDNISKIVSQYTEQKRKLNQAFFSQYSRFIQEGTWLSEEYVDDEKYYADALSVMYNSCYPQVTYTINVLELSQNEGYELFQVELGDKTYAEDKEFFGSDVKEEVVVTELSEDLDDPSKNKVKVQNFKNQFQDLFQKITATVQQAKYSTGSYEKAVALAEANQERKQQFLTDALDSASARLAAAGQQSVTWGNDGITVKSVDSPCDAIRMVGGAILLSKQDKNGQQKWVTGVTSDGVSASLITAGVVNTGEIALMNYDEPVFRWDTFGISAYDAEWTDTEAGSIISNVNSKKFVRFDKYGIYGINESGAIDGANWHPDSIDKVMENATFALTWEGLKIVGNEKVEAKIGKLQGNIINITKEGQTVFNITNSGDLEITGTITGSTFKNKEETLYLSTTADGDGKVLKIGDRFSVKSDGTLSATNGSFSGAITSSSINCNDKFVVTDEGSVTASDISITGGQISIKDSENKETFAVTNEGALTATNASISGTITGSTITGGSISIGGTTEKPNFHVATDGTVTLNNDIIWGISASPVQVLYNRTSSEKPTDGTKYSAFPLNYDNTQHSGWHRTFDSSNDRFASYTYDGGNTWGSAIQIVGAKGDPGAPGAPGAPGEPGAPGAPGAPGTSVTVSKIEYAVHTNNTSAPTTGWSTSIPVTTGTYPYLWCKTTFSDGSEAFTCVKGTVTRDELWGALDKEKDAIYYENGKIAIRATAIIAGGLQVGGTAGDPDSEGVIFYASVESDENKTGIVRIAKWKVSEDSIYTGQTYITAGNELKIASLIASSQESAVRFLAGRQFLRSYTKSYSKGVMFSVAEGTQTVTSTVKFNYPDDAVNIIRVNGSYTVKDYRGNVKESGPIAYTYDNNERIISGQVTVSRTNANNVTAHMTVQYESETGALESSAFIVTEDGSLYCKAASIGGKIEATEGSLGGFSFSTDEGLVGQGLIITNNAIKVAGTTSGIELNGLVVKNSGKNATKMIATGPLYLQSGSDDSGGAIILDSDGAGDITITYSATLSRTYVTSGTQVNTVYVLKCNIISVTDKNGNATKTKQDHDIQVFYHRYAPDAVDWIAGKNRAGSRSFNLPAGSEAGTNLSSYGINPNYAAIGKNYFAVGASAEEAETAAQNLSWELSTDMGDLKTWGNYTLTEPGITSQVKLRGEILPANNDTTLGNVNNGWKIYYSDMQEASDIRIKNSIESFNSKMDAFFDKLHPVTYRYNFDNQHTRFGFIAQEVHQALLEATFLPQETRIWGESKDKQFGSLQHLNYIEFVSLNTWQIQKLKPRVSTLEQTILNYETRISNLESELQNLKNS